MRSYTSTDESPGLLYEARVLWRRSRGAARRMPQEVHGYLRDIREYERQVESATGLRVVDKDVLEIGSGQLSRQLDYFALKNRAVGIDLDVIPRGLDVVGYYRLWRRNGTRRLLKTIGRKLMGFDAKFRREMKRQLGVSHLPKPPKLAMDATRMEFPEDSFDFIYSVSVFEHLPDPVAVLQRAVRVLRPGGVIYTHLHLYTCDNGHHDMRLTPPERGGLAYWAHLRPEHQSGVHPFAYINRLRLVPWRELFERELPGVVFEAETDDGYRDELARLRAAGELANYTDEELLTRNLIAIWRKPAPPPPEC